VPAQKKLANSRSFIQSCVKTTKLRTSGSALEKPPKLIDDNTARCAVRAIGARLLDPRFSKFSEDHAEQCGAEKNDKQRQLCKRQPTES
jgi:hypothetical protein